MRTEGPSMSVPTEEKLHAQAMRMSAVVVWVELQCLPEKFERFRRGVGQKSLGEGLIRGSQAARQSFAHMLDAARRCALVE